VTKTALDVFDVAMAGSSTIVAEMRPLTNEMQEKGGVMTEERAFEVMAECSKLQLPWTTFTPDLPILPVSALYGIPTCSVDVILFESQVVFRMTGLTTVDLPESIISFETFAMNNSYSSAEIHSDWSVFGAFLQMLRDEILHMMCLARRNNAAGINWEGSEIDRSGLTLDQVGSFMRDIPNYTYDFPFNDYTPGDWAKFLKTTMVL